MKEGTDTASKFKFLPSVGVPYVDQGRIFFHCRDYKNLSERDRLAIDRICLKAAGGDRTYAEALKEFMTTGRDFNRVCMDHYISAATLDRMRKKFFLIFTEQEVVFR